jgi:hypothetical protein
MLAEAFGHDSEECIATKRKIFALEMKDGAADVSSMSSVTEISANHRAKGVGKSNKTSAANTKHQSAAVEKKQVRGKFLGLKHRPGYRNHIYQKAGF